MSKGRLSLTAALVLLLTVLSACAPVTTPTKSAVPAPGDYDFSLPVDGRERHYILHVPARYNPGIPMPLVIMLHGGGGTASAAMRETGLTEKADSAGFVVVFPEGTRPHPNRPARFKGNPQTWNDGSGRFKAGETGVDDVRFIAALIDDVRSRLAIDTDGIFVTGFSNGASMAYRIGAELADRVAAIAPIASSGLKVSMRDVHPPVSLLAIQGEDDPRNPPAGGTVNIFGQQQQRPSIYRGFDEWANMLDCPNPPQHSERNGIAVTAYTRCDQGSEAVLYVIDGMGHTWPGGQRLLPRSLVGEVTNKIEANDVIWEFFRAHAR